VSEEKEALRAKLKGEIFTLRLRNTNDDYHIGKLLAQLQELHAKPGYGIFLADVRELDIPINTAYRKIGRYRHIEAQWEEGYDTRYYPVRVRPYRNGKDGNFPDWDDLDLVDDADERRMLEAAAERKDKEIAEVIRLDAEKIARAKQEQKTRVQRVNITLLLAPSKREQFKKKWKEMNETVRSAIVYRKVMDENTN
jgi:hypothetical protein